MSPTLSEPENQTAGRTRGRGDQSDRAEVNRRNAQKSTGPRSVEGKARSRLNALKHGMTAESILLPGEDAEEFKARLQTLLDDLKPRNRLEELMIERIARDDWMSIRAERAAAARVAFRLRHDTVERTRKEIDEAVELGHRLLHHLAFPLPVSVIDAEGPLGQAPMTNLPGDPHHPARLLLRLEGTIAGRDWLLGRLADLKERLEIEGLWTMSEGLEMVRLMGKYAIEVAESYEVQFVLLASLCIADKNKPEPKNPEPEKPEEPEPSQYRPGNYQPGQYGPGTYRNNPYTIGRNGVIHRPTVVVKQSIPERIDEIRKGIDEWCEPFTRALGEQRSMNRLNPADVEDARQRLSMVIDQETNRIEEIRAEHEQISALDAAEATARLAFETGPEGDRQRRYVLSRDRLLNRTIDTFLKVRTKSEAGTLDPVDRDEDITLNPVDPDKLPVSDPVANVGPVDHDDAGDPCDREVAADDILYEDHDYLGEPPADSSAAPVGQSPAQNPAADSTCDAESILRNEANSTGPVREEHEPGTVLPDASRFNFLERQDE